MTDIVGFAAIVALVLVVGVALGMLVVPRLERLAEPSDEEPGADAGTGYDDNPG